MEFFLPFQIRSFPFQISYPDKILFIGSCFSEEIGNKLKELKFNVLQNPNGILYDPLSISDSLFTYIENKPFDEENLFELNGLWHSWKHHSSFSAAGKKDVLEKINTSQSGAHAFLKEGNFLIVTLGTAFKYLLKNENKNIANCHKAPANIFEKKLLPVNEIVPDFLSVLRALEIFNPSLKIIFTVSPVKHVRDGVAENNRSKARLIETVHSICEQRKNAFYFPSYEIVSDVLRDYRFYKNDLVHPNKTAINFVFEKFCESLLSKESQKIVKKVKQVVSAANHRPFFKASEAHKKFVDAQIKNIHNLQKNYPNIDLSIEKKYFEEN